MDRLTDLILTSFHRSKGLHYYVYPPFSLRSRIFGQLSLVSTTPISSQRWISGWEKQTLDLLPDYITALQQCRQTVVLYVGEQQRSEIIGTFLIEAILLV